ncbi:hypothetical protein [Thioclava sp. FTW29]|uniref:Uncharacterized protein n=1 Tax=Thioclava litoralis TaxID=3076557 RepID=A0ABZ1E6B9_9RHOB|nr:hypothetical protein RPE78_17705 [Thioclava sp. FTW29]
MKNIVIAAVVALTASAGIASAEGAGHAQLAQQLGLNGADFTTAELTSIDEARRDGDNSTVNYFLNHDNRVAAPAQEVSAGKAQLAAQLGVDPSKYTLAELVTVDSDLRDHNAQDAAFILSGDARHEVTPLPVPYLGQGRDQ